MDIRKMLGTLMIVAVLVASACLPALAGSAAYNEGVALYNKGDYKQAQAAFERAIAQTPYDGFSHYYLALCYQSKKQYGPARQHLQWVVNNAKDNRLRAHATSALNRCPAAPASGSTSSSGAPATANAGDAAPAPRKDLGRCKVIMFETSWCHYCHEFAPTFDDAANKYRGKMDFQRVDAEQNTSLRDQYGIRSYPTLVYLDGRGKVLYTEGRGAFQRRLQELAN